MSEEKGGEGESEAGVERDGVVASRPVVGCFFFSSRRRHTSSLRDWSSDVCSSDLDGAGVPSGRWGATLEMSQCARKKSGSALSKTTTFNASEVSMAAVRSRSEEVV